jgi:hypothetical protein
LVRARFCNGDPITKNSSDRRTNRDPGAGKRWNCAEEAKDSKPLETLLDAILVYIDYDGTLMDKAQFIASVKEPALHPEQIVNESMTAHVYAGSAVVTGVYRDKGMNHGKLYLRRGRFTDTWVYRDNAWVCVASQSTLILH